MATYEINIPASKMSDVETAFKSLSRIPVDARGDPLFTDSEWVGESLRRHVRDTDVRYRELAARELIVRTPDDSIATVA